MIEPLMHLETAGEKFSEVVRDLPADLFLTPIDNWTPRDVAAHLAWWNRNMLAVCKGLQQGKTPSYYPDVANDFRDTNAQAVAEFSSKDRRVLLEQMNTSLREFKTYLLSLDPKEWDANRGVEHHRGGAATIRRVVESLTGDYENHTQQIERWKTQSHTK